MGKYKKYAKIEQNCDQPNKISSNNNNTNNSQQSNKMINKKREINNKNELNNFKDRNYIKKDESPISKILWEIYDAMKYFFIMCKNFILPSGISFKVFASFLILELLYQGIIIYIIKSVLFVLNKYFSIWTRLTNMYIYIISYVQMIYIFICEGLLIFRFIHLKIYLFKKINWLINILTCIIIILNAISINEINSKVYKFHGKNNNLFLDINKNIKDNIVNEYINLYVNKNDDFQYYELCYEIKFNYFIFEKIKNKIPSFHWHFDSNLNLYIGCKNFSLSKRPFSDNSQKHNLFFNCQNKFDTNTAPNFCVSSKYRQKRFYSHLKIAIFEVMILILWNLYNYFSIELIYHYYPFLKENLYEHNNYINKNNNNYNNDYKYNNNKNIYKNNNKTQTVTYKDINDKEINESEYIEEEEEEEYEEEESPKRNEEYKKQNSIKEYKIRKISKRKMKTYKKKRKKNRYKEEKNKNIYFDEEILSKDYYENNEDNDYDLSDNNDDDKEDDNFFKFVNNNLNSDKEKNDLNQKNDDEDNEDSDNLDKEEDELETHSYIAKKNKFDEFWKLYLKKIRKHQYIQRIFIFIFGNYIDWIKNKIHHILLEIDKNLSDDDE